MNVKAPLLHSEGASDGLVVGDLPRHEPARCRGEFRSAAGDQGLEHCLQIARVNVVASHGDEEVQLELYLSEKLSEELSIQHRWK